jgi:membrane protease YdiL (CAAX protease family)
MITLKMSEEKETIPGEEKAFPAPIWHFVSFIVLFVSIAYGGRHLFAFAHPSESGARLFAILIAINVVLTLYAFWGFRLSGNEDRVLCNEASSAKSIGEDIAIGVALFVGCLITSILLGVLFHGTGSNHMPRLARTDLDRLLGLILTFVAPICEEIQFRGYLLRELDAITRNTGVAIVLQAAFFVMMHGSGQGISGYLTRFVYGIAFGLIAIRRNSLWPSMTAHLLVDLTVFLVAGI